MLSGLAHVVENALESMPNGGTLSLGADRIENEIVIAVKDTGCGISKGQLDAVYDPFVTSKPRGAGLGLTLVHKVVMNHQGEIKIQSELGKGTTVTIRLPVHAARSSEEPS